MKDLFTFMSDNPVTTFFICLLLYGLIEVVFFRLPNRLLRHIGLWKNGYPPPHCDADGDFKQLDSGNKD